jgi:hypothetical protein
MDQRSYVIRAVHCMVRGEQGAILSGLQCPRCSKQTRQHSDDFCLGMSPCKCTQDNNTTALGLVVGPHGFVLDRMPQKLNQALLELAITTACSCWAACCLLCSHRATHLARKNTETVTVTPGHNLVTVTKSNLESTDGHDQLLWQRHL